MGTISEIFDVVGLAKTAQKEVKADPTKIKAVSSLFSKAKSISSQASKYVMEYPVACTTAISEFDVALAITKQVEFDCARFIILASGLNPVIKSGSGDTIDAHINSLISSYESYSGFKVSIKPATQSFEDAGYEYMNKYYSQELYSIYKEDNETSDHFSTEAVKQNIDDDDDDDTSTYNKRFEGNGGYKEDIIEFLKTYSHRQGDEMPPVQNIIGPKPQDATAAKEWDKANDFYNKSSIVNGAHSGNDYRLNAINDRLGKVSPTIITLNLFIQDGNGVDREIQLPLAIKATLQYVDSVDIRDMLGSANITGKKLLNFIKMTTGQISFFKDWLLALDNAKKDVERERTIGHTPFFRRLMSNKSKYRLKTIGDAIPVIKKFIASKTQQDLPMCTLIIDETELRTIGYRLNDCIKNRAKYIDPILDQYMLLGLGIVDKENDIIYFFYSGESDPIIAKISDLGSNGGNTNISSDLSKALANMSKFITKR